MSIKSVGHQNGVVQPMALRLHPSGHFERVGGIAARASRCALGLVAVFLLVQAALGAQTVEGKVTKVWDADSVWVTDAMGKRWRVRLVGIDAPELGQSGGEEARRVLADRVLGEPVTMEVVGYDGWKRGLGILYHRGMNVNLWLIQGGVAWTYRGRPNNCPPALRREIEAAETEARAAARGLWADANAVPPDVQRRMTRSPERARGQPSGEQRQKEW